MSKARRENGFINSANDEYWWSDEGDPVYYNDDVVQELTDKEMKRIEEQEEIWREACMKEARERRNLKDRERKEGNEGSYEETYSCFACQRAL